MNEAARPEVVDQMRKLLARLIAPHLQGPQGKALVHGESKLRQMVLKSIRLIFHDLSGRGTKLMVIHVQSELLLDGPECLPRLL
jgi:hypothetical protein